MPKLAVMSRLHCNESQGNLLGAPRLLQGTSPGLEMETS